MPTTRESVFAALSTAGTTAADRFFPVVNNSNPLVVPFAIFAGIDTPDNNFAGEAIVNTRLQIDAFDYTAAGAQLLAQQIADAMKILAATIPNIRILVSESYEDVPKLYRTTSEFSILI